MSKKPQSKAEIYSEYIRNVSELDRLLVSISSGAIISVLAISKYVFESSKRILFYPVGITSLILWVLVILCVICSFILATRRDNYRVFSPSKDVNTIDKKVTFFNISGQVFFINALVNSVFFSAANLVAPQWENEFYLWPFTIAITIISLVIVRFCQSDKWY